MKIRNAYVRDSYGWPVVFIAGSPITNVIRLLLHTSVRKTWEMRKRTKPEPWDILYTNIAVHAQNSDITKDMQ